METGRPERAALFFYALSIFENCSKRAGITARACNNFNEDFGGAS